ncbi:MAG: hypothetical protein ACOCVZ_07130 [Gemmatimonadota bacterium]
MSTFRDLRQRRFVQYMIGYLATGWVMVEVVSQLTDHGVLPGLAYRLAWLWFLGGLPAAALVAWHHGEQGKQRAPRSEVALLLVIVLTLVGFSVRSVNTELETRRAVAGALEGDLPPERLAVLYLDDESRQDTLRHLADAFTEDLITALSRVPQLQVVSAGGVRAWRDAADLDVPAIAATLGTGTVVTGSVREAGQGVAVDLALVDGASGAVFRRTSLEIPLFVFIEGGTRIARETAELLRERLGEEVRLKESRAETDHTMAWSDLQRAQRFMSEAAHALEHAHDPGGADGLYERADSLLARAAARDTAWVRPVAFRSEVAYRRARIPAQLSAGLSHTVAAIRHGEEAVARDASDAHALEARGTALYWRWLTDPALEPPARDALFRRARDDLEGAVARDPGRASAYATLSHLYYNDPEAPGLTAVLVTAQRAWEEDEFLESAEQVLWRIHTAALDIGQFGPAVSACHDGRQRFPRSARFQTCRLRLMATPALEPDVHDGWAIVAAVDSLAGEHDRRYLNVDNRLFMALVLDAAGMADSARAVLERASRDADDPHLDPHRDLWLREAIVRSRLGETGRAIDLVGRYMAANPGHHFDQRRGLSWWWRTLETEPAFQRLLAIHNEQAHH